MGVFKKLFKSRPKEIDKRKREIFKSSISLAGISPLIYKEDPFSLPVRKPPFPDAENWYIGQEKIIPSACGMCPVNCGILVRVVEGRPVKISGNPNSSPNRGVLGPKGNSGLFMLYDPDRIRSPLLRENGKFKEVDWDTAIGKVVEVLRSVKPEKIAVLCGRPQGFSRELFERFARVLGTPNFYDYYSKSYSTLPLALAMEDAFGVRYIPGYDAENTKYILSLGSALFETTCHGLYFSRASYIIRRGEPVFRAKIVQVEPFLSATGVQADEVIYIKPGKYDVFALGLANVLISEGLYDKDFIERKTEGFKRFSDVAKDFPPSRVERETGVPSKDIVRIAKELAEAKPSVAVVVDERSTSTTNGLTISCLALCLSALLGAINSPGGLFLKKKPEFSPWKNEPPVPPGKKIDFNSLPESDVEVVFLYYMNPAYSEPDCGRWEKFLEKSFVVSFSPFMDESTALSDVVLPDHTYLERFEDAQPYSSVYYPSFGIRQPVVKPLYNTQNACDTIINIAKKLGFTKEFYWENFEEAVKERLEKYDMEELSEKGWWESKEAVQEFKFVFCNHLPPEEPRWEGEGDIYLLPYKSITYAEGSGANIPYLHELEAMRKKLQAYEGYESFAEISPELANKISVKNKEYVYISSPKGKIKVRVLIRDGIPPDVVVIELGKGHKEFGRFAKGKGVNPREILLPVKGRAGNLCHWATKVKIEKA